MKAMQKRQHVGWETHTHTQLETEANTELETEAEEGQTRVCMIGVS